jgi:hypothetical protein
MSVMMMVVVDNKPNHLSVENEPPKKSELKKVNHLSVKDILFCESDEQL